MTIQENIKIHHVIEKSKVNGPDTRFVIWTQGCPLNCDGCFNQATHSLDVGIDIDIKKLAILINRTKGIRGITLSGGEPLFQPGAIAKLLQLIDKKLDVLLFSGYTLDEIKADVVKNEVLQKVDAALLGRYDKNLPHPFYGKKLVLKGDRITKEELKPWLKTEIVINDNDVQITGLYKN